MCSYDFFRAELKVLINALLSTFNWTT